MTIKLIGSIYSSGSGILEINGSKSYISYPYTDAFIESITDEQIEFLSYVVEDKDFKDIKAVITYLREIYVKDKKQNKILVSLIDNNVSKEPNRKQTRLGEIFNKGIAEAHISHRLKQKIVKSYGANFYLSIAGLKFMKHLVRGVKLGLFDEERAVNKFMDWQREHEQMLSNRRVANRSLGKGAKANKLDVANKAVKGYGNMKTTQPKQAVTKDN